MGQELSIVLGAVLSKLRAVSATKSVFKVCGINGWINGGTKPVRKFEELNSKPFGKRLNELIH